MEEWRENENNIYYVLWKGIIFIVVFMSFYWVRGVASVSFNYILYILN